MGVPNLEKAPRGLKDPWYGLWRASLRALQEDGLWRPALRPLLDEYVLALRGAHDAREGFAWLDHLEGSVATEEIDWLVLRQIASGLPNVWDRHARRAAMLAEQLGLSPKARKVLVRKDGVGESADPFDALDELAPRRQNRSQAS